MEFRHFSPLKPWLLTPTETKLQNIMRTAAIDMAKLLSHSAPHMLEFKGQARKINTVMGRIDKLVFRGEQNKLVHGALADLWIQVNATKEFPKKINIREQHLIVLPERCKDMLDRSKEVVATIKSLDAQLKRLHDWPVSMPLTWEGEAISSIVRMINGARRRLEEEKRELAGVHDKSERELATERELRDLNRTKHEI